MPVNIYLTRRIPQPAIDLLSSYFEVSINPHDRNVRRAELLEHLKDADALLCQLIDSIDRGVIDSAPRLRCICNNAVGYNNIDVAYATEKGIAVCNTPGVLTEATADLAWALIMSCSRRIVESDKYVREGNFTGWEPMLMLGSDIYGKTLGIVGMGRIGEAVARRSAGFGMKVLAYHPRRPLGESPEGWHYVDLDTLLKEADIISLHVPLTPETKNMIGRDELRLLKNSAIFINTARGAVVDEEALIEMLTSRKIAAAGFDVYIDEPYVPPELKALSNVVLLPHIGSATVETRTAMAMMAARNAIAIFKNETPPSRIN